MNTLLLSRDNVQSVITMELALEAVERAFEAHGRGESEMPPKVYLALEHHEGDFRAMPAYIEGAAGVKWVNSHPHNPERHGMPAVMGLFILSDPSTAAPLAVMDATLLTAVRTGAAAGVASKYLAKKAPRTVGFLGCGVQARYILESHRAIFGSSFEPMMADISRAAAERFAEEANGRAVCLEEAAGADIVCTAMPSRRPIVRREWIRPGTHINAMGADAHGKQELEPQILQDARVYIDDWKQGTESGEVNVPLHEGSFSRDAIAGTLGELIVSRRAARTREDEITVFDSTGLAVQDVALALVVFQEARDRSLGTPFRFIP